MLYHDSKDNAYRTPPGAGACLSRIVLRIKATPRPDKVFLRLWWDEREQIRPMTVNADGLWEIEMTLPNLSGNLWYYFIIYKGGNVTFYGNAQDRLGGEGCESTVEPTSFQITVYDPQYETPEWMRNGILYQIMVDRFYASKPLAERPKPYLGWMHERWNEYPELRNFPDGDNEACDFFGGDLQGIIEKLPYLKQLGVSALYLNPVFRARSNHKYDTGDYRQIDPSFGTNEDFAHLCEKAKAHGMHLIIDGVFSHTGSDSRYFNEKDSYDSMGAYQSKDSPYASWYKFIRWPDQYESWWGFNTLPNVQEMSESFLDFIIHSDDAVCAHWIKAGTSGWRLDVADELPMTFLRMLRKRVKQTDADAAILGEVWENASNKLAYGEGRNYCVGDTLDSVMNYPLRDGLIDFMMGRMNAVCFVRIYEDLQYNYAPQFFYSLMNMLGSHDKPRIIDVLSGVNDLEPPRDQRHSRTLTREQYARGKQRFIALWTFVCALPGMPCLYYADEAGQTGMADPFCRATYPWGEEDTDLLKQIKAINHARAGQDVFTRGSLKLYAPCDSLLVCVRRIENGRDVFGNPAKNAAVLCALNRSDVAQSIVLPADSNLSKPVTVSLDSYSATVIEL